LLTLYGKLKVSSNHASPPGSATNAAREPFKLTIALIDEMRIIAESRSAKFMIVSTDRWWNGPSGATYSDLINTLRAKGFLVLDVESIAGFDPEVMLIPDDGHWNQAGHGFVAEKIKSFLETRQLLSRP
jgi:hypothetical protein